MTLSDIEQDLYRRLGFPTSPDTVTTTRLRALINETQQEILSEPGMEVLLDDELTFASVASTPEYSLPASIANITSIRNQTNRRTLMPQSQAWYRDAYPDPTAVTGIPDAWVELGFSPVATQPSNASELFVKSDSASDAATRSVIVEGYTTGGAPRSVTVAMNGVTAVSLGATITTWVEITKFYFALGSTGATTPTAGNVTLNEDSGAGTELARIPIGQSYSRYKRIALAICPSSAITYYVDFQRDVTDMSALGDQPILPPRFHRLLGVGARMREYEKQNQMDRYKAAQAEYIFGLKKLKYFVFSQTAGSPNLRGRVGRDRPSQLGGWYGAGT